MSDFKKASEIENTSVVKRRSFLKKSATGAVLVSLPAQSVWGACSVSGAMSGNLSQNTDRHDCDIPLIPAGLSPGYWSQLYNGSNGINGTFANVKGGNEEWKTGRRECYRNHIKDFIDSDVSMGLSTEIYTGIHGNLKSALMSSNGGGDGSLEFNLAGVFLSSYFGFYGSNDEKNITMASQRVNQIALYIFVKANQNEVPSKSELTGIFNFNKNSVTNYTVDFCNMTFNRHS
tara:strand:- start:453 stop:1148 length:696 start_codon:yes stop_codon:yes gene_type:complete